MHERYEVRQIGPTMVGDLRTRLKTSMCLRTRAMDVEVYAEMMGLEE